MTIGFTPLGVWGDQCRFDETVAYVCDCGAFFAVVSAAATHPHTKGAALNVFCCWSDAAYFVKAETLFEVFGVGITNHLLGALGLIVLCGCLRARGLR